MIFTLCCIIVFCSMWFHVTAESFAWNQKAVKKDDVPLSQDNNTTMRNAMEEAYMLQSQVPIPKSVTNGEMEDVTFWEHHEAIFQQAWRDFYYGRMAEMYENTGKEIKGIFTTVNKRSVMPVLRDSLQFLPPIHDPKDIIDLSLYHRVKDLWHQPTIEKEQALMKPLRSKNDFLIPISYHQVQSPSHKTGHENEVGVWKEVISNVWEYRNFLSKDGIQRLRSHMDVIQRDSNIPLRRPNGMNRHGMVIDDDTPGGVSAGPMLDFRTWLIDDYMRPLSRMLFPEYSSHRDRIGEDYMDDDKVGYAFTIHYRSPSGDEISKNATCDSVKRSQFHDDGGDIQLADHTDASLFTLNINLNLPMATNSSSYEGSDLQFYDEREKRFSTIQMKPGMAILHRGLHRHQALPIKSGERHQLVVWLFGREGYVRVLPYLEKERSTVGQRWSSV